MREKIKLVSTAGTGHFYTTTKNKRLHPDKMEVKKFDPKARKHVAYKEDEDQVRRPAGGGSPTERKSPPFGGLFVCGDRALGDQAGCIE